jgi:hypothetical protein
LCASSGRQTRRAGRVLPPGAAAFKQKTLPSHNLAMVVMLIVIEIVMM